MFVTSKTLFNVYNCKFCLLIENCLKDNFNPSFFPSLQKLRIGETFLHLNDVSLFIFKTSHILLDGQKRIALQCQMFLNYTHYNSCLWQLKSLEIKGVAQPTSPSSPAPLIWTSMFGSYCFSFFTRLKNKLFTLRCNEPNSHQRQ